MQGGCVSVSGEAAFTTLKERLGEITDLRGVTELLGWDRETYLPPAGAEARAEQIATLSRIAHVMFTSDETGELLDAAASWTAGLDPESNEARLVVMTRRDYERDRRLPDEFVARLARTTSLATSVWERARPDNDYACFKPHLAEVIACHIELAELLGYDEHPYDALLDLYEPEMRTAQVRGLFDALRDAIVPLGRAIGASEPISDAPLHGHFDPAAQLAFGREVIAQVGFDFTRGRQDLSAHPFCSGSGSTDVRITTRVAPTFLSTALFGTIHEAGHALYEMGIDPALGRTPLGRGISLGLHESQSRLWENVVGRSRPFWRHFYPPLQQHFPAQFADCPFETFYRAINVSRPSLVRIEADEVTYNLHIMLRFELELALLERRLGVDELPDAWNELSDRYLGIIPPSDAMGVMQDIHWSAGLIGYFPTYTIGNVLAVQFFEAAVAAYPKIPDELAAGEFGTLLGWMRANIHRHGAKFLPGELIQRATGRPLDPAPYLRYLNRKYRDLYALPAA